MCIVCGREIDRRGMSGHMKSHKAKAGDGDESGVISYPSNEQETVVKQDVVLGNTETPNNVKQPKKKKAVKKTVTSKPASSPASNPDSRGQRKSEQEHKEEWKGFFRE